MHTGRLYVVILWQVPCEASPLPHENICESLQCRGHCIERELPKEGVRDLADMSRVWPESSSGQQKLLDLCSYRIYLIYGL